MAGHERIEAPGRDPISPFDELVSELIFRHPFVFKQGSYLFDERLTHRFTDGHRAGRQEQKQDGDPEKNEHTGVS